MVQCGLTALQWAEEKHTYLVLSQRSVSETRLLPQRGKQSKQLQGPERRQSGSLVGIDKILQFLQICGPCMQERTQDDFKVSAFGHWATAHEEKGLCG